MCSIKINRDNYNKLTHASLEIRLRTLEQLSTKLNRALELNSNIEFKPSDVCKQLIRWFEYSPPQQSIKVLNLLKSIIESSKYGSQAINKLGSERLIKEIRKIQSLFDSQSAEYITLCNIEEFLKNTSQLKEKHQIQTKPAGLNDFVDHIGNLKIEGFSEWCTTDYEVPWSQPSASDFTSMKFLSDILINKFASNTEIENTVRHLQLTMTDYPAEYLLQPPNIFRNLLHIYDERKSKEHKNVSIENVASALLEFLYILEKRLRTSRKSMSFNQSNIEHRIARNFETPCQLKIEKALTELLNASIFYLELHATHSNVSFVVWDVIFMVLKVLQTIKERVHTLCLYQAASVVANLSTKFAKSEHCVRIRLNQMLLILLLQDIAAMSLCPNSMKALEVYEPILRDYTIKSFFTIRYQLTEAFVFKGNSCLQEKYHRLNLYEKSFEISTQMLKNNLAWSSSEIIKEGHLVCKVLDVLQSKELINVLFGGIVRGISFYRENDEIKTKAIDLLLRLLNITFIPLKIYVYENITDAFNKYIGCLMTGERYLLECTNDDLLKAQILGLPLNTDVLKQLIYESFESTCNQIKINCCKMIELLLKSQNLFHTHWFSLLPLLLPLIPLLNCCTFSKEIMGSLVKLFDPDFRKLPFVCVLQGNIGCLFHSNADRRSEALTRLIFMINSLKDAENYIPNLLEISDTIPNDICYYETVPIAYQNIFSDRLPVGCEIVSSLNNLLHLLETPDVEPLIRKTSLMQINVLCNNWHITAELCDAAAFYLILRALESALLNSSKLDYADAVVPAIGILSKVMLYDASVRCELAGAPNIYILILRALFMFHYDVQLRQDATLCLFLLLFSSYIVSTENTTEGPLILRNIKIPLNINLRPALYNKVHQNLKNLSEIFSTALEEIQYWKMVVASSFCGGLKNLTQKSVNILSQLDIRADLKLTSLDIRFIRATQPNVTLYRLLKGAVNAKNHRSLIQACTLLKLQLIVPAFKNTLCINDFCDELNGIFIRYLQIPPGNNDDLDLYENFLDIASICLKIKMEPVALEIFKYMHKDPRHALITMLTQDKEIPFQIYNKIGILQRILISQHKNVLQNHFEPTECSKFYSKLFDCFTERCFQLFQLRDLQRVRCLLSVIAALSSCQLNISDELLFFYCRRFVHLSLGLKSFTQTGAQWHRDCLQVVLTLSNQMQNSIENFRLTGHFIKYLSGLCGHNDVEVRTLAWSILNITAKTNAIDSSATQSKNVSICGTELLVSELSYLPGGFLACCLSTMLDIDEAVSVRHLSGQLLAVLIRTQSEVKEIEKILESHNFIRLATESLSMSICVLDVEIPRDLNVSPVNITTTDLISCYALIFVELSQRSPTFLTELCTKSFMFKLYEILKQPPPASKHVGYLNMVGHICRLYTLCYSNNLDFLQRTLCRDTIWLGSFCKILFGTVAPSDNVFNTTNMLQLLLILLKDSTALEHISIKLREYAIEFVKLFQNALNVKNMKTNFQSCSLSILRLLLLKSQPDVDPAISCHILKLFDGRIVPNKSLKNSEVFEPDVKETSCSTKKHASKGNVLSFKDGKDKSTISEHICILLIRLFIHLYPIKVCEFSSPPNLNQQHITETLALLLKQSSIAQKTAENLKFQDKVLKIFKNFFEEFATTSCSTYLKRNGSNKKLAAIKNLQLLLKFLLSWFSSLRVTITDNMLAMDYCKIVIHIWSWLAHSNDLKLVILKVCSFLSERSLVVCKLFSTMNNISFQHSVLQLTTKMITAETLKVKVNSIDFNTFISSGLRVLINCCSCIEGRNALNKMHVLDVFETLYPYNTKAPQSKKDIVFAWLEFWEIFSRYEEGAQSRHLNALCSVVNKSSPGCSIRLISLRILRNIAFLNSNRSILITSTDFMFTVNEIVSLPIRDSVEEQFIVCVTLWKLISGGVKFAAIIRGTKLAKNLRSLKENLTCTKEGRNETFNFADDLSNVLNIIFKIFNN